MDKDLLISKDRIEEAEHEIPGLGVVRFRALSRAEALEIRGKSYPLDELERQVLAVAMLDPKLTTGEVRLWQEASSAGELEPIMAKITRMSGLDAEAVKQAYESFRDGPGT